MTAIYPSCPLRVWLYPTIASLLLGSLTPGHTAEPIPGRWLVVAPAAFHEELAPLREHRRAEGFTVSSINPTDILTADQIQQAHTEPLQIRIREFYLETNTPCYILLAGMPHTPSSESLRHALPAPRGTIERMKGQFSDYGFTPPPASNQPPVAIGRFPARTAEETRVMVQKTLEFEQHPESDEASRRLVLLAGNPGGGPAAEMLVNATLSQRLAQLHHTWKPQVISCSTGSPHYLSGNPARNAFLDAVQAGSLFTVFMGHSSASAMWLEGHQYLNSQKWAEDISPLTGIFFTCGCFALQLHPPNGYGITLMRNPNGPVAVIGATAESYAATGLLAADGLLDRLHQPPFPTRLADYWRAVQSGLATGAIDSFTFNLYDRFDGSRGKVPLEVQRLEHLEMWMLLGDPALRMPVQDIPPETGPPAP